MDAQNPYASPRSQLAAKAVDNSPPGPTPQGAWADGDLLLVTPNAEFAQRCVKCNAPVNDFRKVTRLSWYPSWAYLALLIGPLPFIVVALVCRKRLTVTISVCEEHRRQRQQAILITWISFGMGFALCVIAVAANHGPTSAVAGLIGFGMMIGGLIYGAIRSRLIWPKQITKEYAWVKGCCPEFLADCPSNTTA